MAFIRKNNGIDISFRMANEKMQYDTVVKD